jgi:hypothetical protein
MKLSKKSKQLILFFNKNNNIPPIKHSIKTDSIIKILYHDILDAYNFILSLKQSKERYYILNTKKIINSSHISKPKNFNSNSFPNLVRNHIDEVSMTEISYSLSLFNRKINIIFIVEEEHIEMKIDIYNRYVDCILMWLYILNQYASKQCANSLTIYLYFTSLEKKLPASNIHILDEINVNTAFTTTCPKDSEIVVFREEEWFKVLIHETFHNFGLDFSDMNTYEVNKCILNIFDVKSEVNLYESYTEFWAEIMNALFCSFISLKNKTDIVQFLSNAEIYINMERRYSFFQLVKTLNFMGLQYSDLYSNSSNSKILRNHFYKEKTNVLAYYVIKTILINNYQTFLQWCKNNNLSLLQFKKTIPNQNEFCRFIQKNYKSKSMLDSINYTQQFLLQLMKKKKINNNENFHYLLNNLRMSICELG